MKQTEKVQWNLNNLALWIWQHSNKPQEQITRLKYAELTEIVLVYWNYFILFICPFRLKQLCLLYEVKSKSRF